MLPIPKIRSAKPILLIVLVTVVCLAAVLYGRWQVSRSQTDANALNLLYEAYSTVMVNYVEKPDSKKLVLKMVDGMLAALDPHSAYLPPEPYNEMEVAMSGAFGGVGIELGIKEGKLTVIAPIDGTPPSEQEFMPMTISGRLMERQPMA